MVPLAWALRSEGHDVRVRDPAQFPAGCRRRGDCCAWPPGRTPTSTRNWARHRGGPCGRRESVEQRRGTASTPRRRQCSCSWPRPWRTTCSRSAGTGRPDLVIFEPRALRGPVGRQTSMGKPAVRHLWGTDYTIGRWDFERAVVEPLFAKHGVRAGEPGRRPHRRSLPAAPANSRRPNGGVHHALRALQTGRACLPAPWPRRTPPGLRDLGNHLGQAHGGPGARPRKCSPRSTDSTSSRSSRVLAEERETARGRAAGGAGRRGTLPCTCCSRTATRWCTRAGRARRSPRCGAGRPSSSWPTIADQFPAWRGASPSSAPGCARSAGSPRQSRSGSA